jgi:hypothetical protein
MTEYNGHPTVTNYFVCMAPARDTISCMSCKPQQSLTNMAYSPYPLVLPQVVSLLVKEPTGACASKSTSKCGNYTYRRALNPGVLDAIQQTSHLFTVRCMILLLTCLGGTGETASTNEKPDTVPLDIFCSRRVASRSIACESIFSVVLLSCHGLRMCCALHMIICLMATLTKSSDWLLLPQFTTVQELINAGLHISQGQWG